MNFDGQNRKSVIVLPRLGRGICCDKATVKPWLNITEPAKTIFLISKKISGFQAVRALHLALAAMALREASESFDEITDVSKSPAIEIDRD